jgi:hypothetical protein
MEETADKIERALQLAGTAPYMLLALVDETGVPRLTPVEECTPAGAQRVAMQAWIDLSSVQSPAGPSGIALLICAADGHGYQLTGRLVRMQEAAVLDGLADIEQQVRFPQVERFLVMQVESVADFHFAPARPTARAEQPGSR